jgi:hypothetical protein
MYPQDGARVKCQRARRTSSGRISEWPVDRKACPEVAKVCCSHRDGSGETVAEHLAGQPLAVLRAWLAQRLAPPVEGAKGTEARVSRLSVRATTG